MSFLSPDEIAARFGVKLTGVIHVGADEGQEVERYVERGLSKICLIEANIAHEQTLNRFCKKYPQVNVDFFAISDRIGVADFNVTSDPQCSSLLDLKLHADIYPHVEILKTTTVETRTLDSLFPDARLAGINLLIIDVQGAELLVLKGAERVLKNIDVVVTEVNFAELYAGCPPVEEIDLFLFDRGFARVETRTPHHSTWGDAAYVRTSLIKDLAVLQLDRRFKISMTSLGSNGRFANQLFQYLFLVLYGLRSGCRPFAPEFPAASYLKHCLISRGDVTLLALPWHHPAESSYLETAYPPRDVDFWGYFQAVPDLYRTHKDFIRELLRPAFEIEDAANRWLTQAYSSYKRIIGLHIRRGDYVDYDDNNLGIHSRAPTEFYLSWLERIFEVGDALFISTDDGDEFQHFARFPVLNTLFERPAGISDLHGDFYILSQCDVAAYCNSSWSLMSGLLAKKDQKAFLIDFQSRTFFPFDPWSGTFLWARFQPTGYSGIPLIWQDSNVQVMQEFAYCRQKLAQANQRLDRAKWLITAAEALSPSGLKHIAHNLVAKFSRARNKGR